MKKEDREILLRDLSARLPYKVKVYGNYKYHNGDRLVDDKKIEVLDLSKLDWFVNGIDIKPYLRHISSMTEAEKKELSARWLWTQCFDDINLAYLCDSVKDYVACSSGEYFELQDWLNANHFDYRELIPKGLALEAPKDMYNEIEEEKK